ncbi:MAG: apolipoprotein N-acyltransferase, partial [Candidatus Eisenbacteria sp.]|nr:apolipoprotein N-acyltransferase [Candidatus Eisenbacteria bacterium]
MRDPVGILRSFWGSLALAGVSGLALALAFAPFNQGWVSFVALTPFLYLVDQLARQDRRTGWRVSRALFGFGWFFGFVFFLVLLRWMASLTTERMVYPALRWPATMAASAYLAVYFGVFSVGVGFFRRRLGRAGLWVAPPVWVLVEVLRASGALGFPWGALGYGLVRHPSLIQGASLGGVDLLSFWIVSVNLGVLFTLMSVGAGRARLGVWILGLTLLVGAPWAWGRARIPEQPGPRLGRVGIVQPSARGDDKWDPANRDSSFTVLERGTRRVAKRDVDLVIWPETAVPLYLRYDAAYFERVSCLARGLSRELLIGFPDASAGRDDQVRKFNAAGLFDRTGVLIQTYWKIHLVPFGEALPWQNVFPILERIDLGEGDYSPGEELTVFKSSMGRFPVLICFESIFPRLSRRLANEGADFLVNITNDDWFGNTPAAAQHAAMAVMRAVENGMSLVRCANSGISMIVDPYGRIERQTPLFQRMELVGPVAGPLPGTMYRSVGDGFVLFCGTVITICLVLCWR